MSYEWDKTKAQVNLKKHKVALADAVSALEDPGALTVDDVENGEERFVTVGMDCFGRILVVVYTWRGDSIRMISARKAAKTEIKDYQG
ncbi:MAG TPA: hypothetical protein DCZ94_14020 [Lentisphaeria bacterium]|nr:MAG: hypothetical protein A2X48_03840 [Lentisphaerae bacterium GWF2_49_21]HBC88062.1 hypothetical protein [Lentisphaeria bacterium]